MIISLINHTNLPDMAVQQAIRAVNVQIEQDFYPYWSIGATLRLEGRIGENPDLENLAASLRGDAILYLEDTIDKEDPLGFHNLHFSGIPFGFVFTEISGQMGEPWQVTLSHEALELIADAEVNRLIMGPHPDPAQKGRMVFHWYEMCDAVQAERCISPTPWRDDAPKSNRSSASRGAAFKPLPTGRVPGSRVRAVPLIKSETGRAKAGGRRERSSG